MSVPLETTFIPRRSRSDNRDKEQPNARTSPPPNDVAQPTLYRYQPLSGKKSIRLLELLPDKRGAPLRCQMRQASLNRPPSYSAISYVWGPADFIKQIYIGTEVLKITKSCSKALHRLRDYSKSRLYWIDACCINQGSDGERNHQVGIMGDIYSKAVCTLVWLGEMERDGDARAMKYIEDGIPNNVSIFGMTKHDESTAMHAGPLRELR